MRPARQLHSTEISMHPEEESGSFNLEAALLGGEQEPNETESTQESPANPSKTALRDTLARGSGDELNTETDDENGFPAAPGSEETEDEAGEVEEEAEAPPPALAAAAPTQEEIDLFAEAQELGVDLSKYGNDKKAAARGLLHAAKLVGRKTQLEEYGRQALENPKALYEFLHKQYGQATADAVAAATAATTAAKRPSDVPEYDEAWLQSFDEDGKLLPGADPALPGKIKKYREFVSARATRLAVDPLGELLPLLEGKIAAIADEKAAAAIKVVKAEHEQQQRAYEYQQYAQSIVQAEAKWAFVEGDRAKGPTEAGKIYHKWLEIGEQPLADGRPQFNDLSTLSAWAKSQTQIELMQLEKSNAAPARKVQQGKLTNKPNRGPSADKSGGWKKGQTLEDALLGIIQV